MQCPFCKEKIKSDALKCKHCGSDLSDYHRRQREEKAAQPLYKKWWVWVGVLLLPGMCQALIGGQSSSTTPTTTTSSSVPTPPAGENFKKMSPAEHLANGKSALASNKFTVAKMHLEAVPKDAKEFAEADKLKLEIAGKQAKFEAESSKKNKITSDDRSLADIERKVADTRKKMKKYYATPDDVNELNKSVILVAAAKAVYAKPTDANQRRILSKACSVLPKAELTLREAFASSMEEVFVKNGMDARVKAVGDGGKTLKVKYALMSQPLVYKFQNEINLDSKAQSFGFKKIIYTNGFESSLGMSWTVKL